MANSKRIKELENEYEGAFRKSFGLFDALMESAEMQVAQIEHQRISAINALNETIKAHNELEVARAKRAVEFAKQFDELDREMRESNKRLEPLYKKAQEVFDRLTDRLDKALKGENIEW